MQFNVLFRHDSEVLGCSYRFGKTAAGLCVYVWTNRNVDECEIPADGLDRPEANHGAIVGTCDEVRDEYENCVGAFRGFDDPEAEEARLIVDGANAALFGEVRS
jgi:hypothetical protein